MEDIADCEDQVTIFNFFFHIYVQLFIYLWLWNFLVFHFSPIYMGSIHVSGKLKRISLEEESMRNDVASSIDLGRIFSGALQCI